MLYGFPTDAWIADIKHLITKIKYNEKMKSLEAKAEALKKYYSEDKQADIAINEILASL
jgi:putative sterol carrier protein